MRTISEYHLKVKYFGNQEKLMAALSVSLPFVKSENIIVNEDEVIVDQYFKSYNNGAESSVFNGYLAKTLFDRGQNESEFDCTYKYNDNIISGHGTISKNHLSYHSEDSEMNASFSIDL